MPYLLLNLNKNRKKTVIDTLTSRINDKLTCLAVRKLEDITLGVNIPTEELYYNYIKLNMLVNILEGINCNSPCYNMCIDNVIDYINELLYKFC